MQKLALLFSVKAAIILSSDIIPTAERRIKMDFKRDESLQKRKNTGYSDTARIMRRALGVTAMRGSDFDPDGSYTGVCDNIYEKPVQDADDL